MWRGCEVDWAVGPFNRVGRTLHPASRLENGMRRPSDGSFGHSIPSRRANVGYGVRMHPAADATSHFDVPFRDTASRLHQFWTPHPILQLRNGTRRPKGLGCGRRIPFRRAIPGCNVRLTAIPDAVSRFATSFRDTASSQGSTSFSHDGSGLCLTPATCSMCSSTPGVRTSRIVKRMSGCP